MRVDWKLVRSQGWGIAALMAMAAVVIAVVNLVPQPAQQRAEAERAQWQARMDSVRRVDSLQRASRRHGAFDRDSMYAAWDAQHRRKKDSLHALWNERDSLYRDSVHRAWQARRTEDSLRYDSIGRTYRVKKDTVVCLNRCDTTDLLYLRGVGKFTAVHILRYGQALGGYVSAEQIREIEELKNQNLDSVIPHLTVCLDSVRPIRINHATQRQLQRHPYVTYEQSVELYELRRMRGTLRGWDDLRRAKTLRETDIERLKMYISFAE